MRIGYTGPCTSIKHTLPPVPTYMNAVCLYHPHAPRTTQNNSHVTPFFCRRGGRMEASLIPSIYILLISEGVYEMPRRHVYIDYRRRYFMEEDGGHDPFRNCLQDQEEHTIGFPQRKSIPRFRYHVTHLLMCGGWRGGAAVVFIQGQATSGRVRAWHSCTWIDFLSFSEITSCILCFVGAILPSSCCQFSTAYRPGRFTQFHFTS